MAQPEITKDEMRHFLKKQLDLLSKENDKISSAKPEDADEERMKKNTLERIEREVEIIGALSSLIL